MGISWHIDIPRRASRLLVEISFHHTNSFRQPPVPRVLRAEGHGNTGPVPVRTSKAVTSAVEPDPGSVNGLDEADRVQGTEMQPIRDRLSVSHKRIDAVP